MHEELKYTPQGKPIYSIREIRDNNYMWACHNFTSQVSIVAFKLEVCTFKLDTPDEVHEWLKDAFSLETTRLATDAFEELMFKYNGLTSYFFNSALPERRDFADIGKHQLIQNAIDSLYKYSIFNK